MDDTEKFTLLKKINDKMTWALLLLFMITLNTCSVADDIEDAVRGGGGEASTPAVEAPAQSPAA